MDLVTFELRPIGGIDWSVRRVAQEEGRANAEGLSAK